MYNGHVLLLPPFQFYDGPDSSSPPTPHGWLLRQLLKVLRTSASHPPAYVPGDDIWTSTIGPLPPQQPIGPTVDPTLNHEGIIGYLTHTLTRIRK